MPYFIHPKLRRFEKDFDRLKSTVRPVRIGFAGTINDAAYKARFAFPIMSRSDVFDIILSNFANSIASIRSKDMYNSKSCKPYPIIIVSVDKTSDTTVKHILQGLEYLKFLGKCAFAVAPPGCHMPQSHNLIEAMFLGAIPISNYASYLSPPLENGINCLSFDTQEDLCAAIQKALNMDEKEIERLRVGVAEYATNHLSTTAFGRRLRVELKKSPTIVVNGEDYSVSLWKSRRLSASESNHSIKGCNGSAAPPYRR
jgi:hypothetical protein